MIGFLLADRYTYLSNTKVIISLIFIIVYLFWYHKNKTNEILLFIVIVIELGVNIGFSFITKKEVYDTFVGIRLDKGEHEI